VSSTDPENGEQGVAINRKITVTFTEAIDPLSVASTSAFTVTGPDGSAVFGTATSAGVVAIFTPTGNLSVNATFTATINTSVKDLAGNSLAKDHT